MIDAHCHLDHPRFDADRAAVQARARAAGIEALISAGVEPEGWSRQSALACAAGAATPAVHVAYGLHPWTVAGAASAAVVDAALARLADALDGAGGLARPVALGEVGLDRSRRAPAQSLPRQEAALRAQLALARERDLPVVLHVVGALGRALEVLRRDGLPGRGGLLHAYGGPAELVADFARLGLRFSFGGAVTWPRARRAPRALMAVPDERLLLETDAPFAPPAPAAADARVEPADLTRVLSEAAALRGTSPEALARLTTRNARALFGL